MPPAKNVGEPCAGEPHARFDAAAGGNQASRQARAAPAPPADPTATPEFDVRSISSSRRCEPLPSRSGDVYYPWSDPVMAEVAVLRPVQARGGRRDATPA